RHHLSAAPYRIPQVRGIRRRPHGEWRGDAASPRGLRLPDLVPGHTPHQGDVPRVGLTEPVIPRSHRAHHGPANHQSGESLNRTKRVGTSSGTRTDTRSTPGANPSFSTSIQTPFCPWTALSQCRRSAGISTKVSRDMDHTDRRNSKTASSPLIFNSGSNAPGDEVMPFGSPPRTNSSPFGIPSPS